MSAALLGLPRPMMPAARLWSLVLCICSQTGFWHLSALTYNDCQRTGPSPQPPDPDSLPVWSGKAADFFDDYRPLKDINRYLEQLHAAHPKVVRFHQIGKSWEGRPLRVVEVSINGDTADKPCIFLMGGIHAREWIAVSTVLYLATALIHAAEKEAGHGPVTSALKQFTFAFLAPANPDGYVFTWESNRMWRKTRSNRTGESCGTAFDGVGGVDANRNWGYKRGVSADAAYEAELALPCADDFEGPSAFSEPEVTAVANYMKQRQERSLNRSFTDARGKLVMGPGYVSAFLDYHAFGMLMLPPWSYSGKWPPSPDKEYMRTLTNRIVKSVNNVDGRDFKGGPDLLRPDPGTGPDWALGVLGIRATMTIELEGGPAMDQQNAGFCVSKDFIKPAGQEQWAGLQALVHHIQERGGEPSTLFGLRAHSSKSLKSPVPCAIAKYTSMDSLAWASHKSGMHAAAFVGCLLTLLSLFACFAGRKRSWQRQRALIAPAQATEPEVTLLDGQQKPGQSAEPAE